MNVVTISREFGSGGREVGKRLADALGYEYYDSEIIAMIAEKANLSEEYVSNVVERAPSYAIHFGSTFSALSNFDTVTTVLLAQRQVFEEFMHKSNCVIVGRGASCLLGQDNVCSIFVYASEESKLKRCVDRSTDPKETAKSILKKMKKIDSNRRHYHESIFGVEWGRRGNYDLMINTSDIEIKSIIPSLAGYVQSYFQAKK